MYVLYCMYVCIYFSNNFKNYEPILQHKSSLQTYESDAVYCGAYFCGILLFVIPCY